MNRAEKLKKLDQSKAAKNMLIVTDGEPFLHALQEKIEQLREVLGAKVGVDLDELINQLKVVETIAPHIDKLIEALQSIDIPETPSSIEVKGLEGLNLMIESHIKELQKMPEIKVPEARVKVDVINQKHVQDITKKLDVLIKAIEKNTLKIQTGQTPDDFIPVRKVIKIGGRLVFDDTIGSGGGGGGGGNDTIQATENGQDSLPVVNPDGSNIVTLPSSASVNSVADTATATDLKAANTSRKEIEFVNTSSAILYLLKGSGTPSATNFTVRMEQWDYYKTNFRGLIRGVWASDPGDGAAMITEST